MDYLYSFVLLLRGFVSDMLLRGCVFLYMCSRSLDLSLQREHLGVDLTGMYGFVSKAKYNDEHMSLTMHMAKTPLASFFFEYKFYRYSVINYL